MLNYLAIIFLCSWVNNTNIDSSNPSEFVQAETISSVVFNKLKRTKGLFSFQAPHLKLVEELPNLNFAMAMARGDSIFLDIKSYRVCQSLGKDSLDGLAFLLAHELAHFTRKHDERFHFKEKNQEDRSMALTQATISRTKKSLNDTIAAVHVDSLTNEIDAINLKHKIRSNEIEADLEAGFMSYLAGFKTLSSGAHFLEEAYEEFDLQKEGGNYVSLAERQEIIFNTQRELDTLVSIFQMANYSTVIEEWDQAKKGYEFVLKSFGSADLLNNMGMLCLLEVSRTLSCRDIPYVLPMALDISAHRALNPIRSKVKGCSTCMTSPGADLASKRRQAKYYFDLMDKAIEYFERALLINSEYYIADLNKSITFILRDALHRRIEHDDGPDIQKMLFAETSALTGLNKIVLFDEENQKARARIFSTLAIIKHVQKDSAVANIFIDKAIRADSSNMGYRINKKCLKGDWNALVNFLMSEDNDTEMDCMKKESIFNGSSFNALINALGDEWSIQKEIELIDPDSALAIRTTSRYVNKGTFELYQVDKIKGKSRMLKRIRFFVTKPNYKFPSACNIQINDNQNKLLLNYGKPSRILETEVGTLFTFYKKQSHVDKEGVVFLVDDSKVKSWINFNIEKF